MCKILVDDTSLFSKVYFIKKSVSKFIAGLEKISYLAYQWEMQCNPDSNKQANEVIFSQKPSSSNFLYSPIRLDNNDIFKCTHQKH